MFTGLIREIGTVESIDRDATGARIRVGASLAAELRDGDSVAVTGACLTLAARADRAFEADVMNQTLSLTTLGDLEPGAAVNLEPALRAGEPLGGHFVQGHVDGTGEVLASSEDGFSRRIRVAVPAELGRYLVEHGSVAVDGVSLTVSGLADRWFEVALIPETLASTTLGNLGVGDPVNLEMDLIARYAERLMQGFADPERKGNA
ncbi:MAG: riboflavin synthase [Solirubrobacterales bacterium]